eukprot:s4477_g3.t1
MRNPTLAQDFREGCTDTALFQERVGQTALNQRVCAETEQDVKEMVDTSIRLVNFRDKARCAKKALAALASEEASRDKETLAAVGEKVISVDCQLLRTVYLPAFSVRAMGVQKSVSGSVETQTLGAMTHLARSANAVPAAELRKLCYTTAQAIHDGAGPLKPGTAGAGENFHSLRETQHVPLERAASAPGGTLRRGTSYEKDFGEEPVFIDLEVNRAQANLLKSKRNHVKAPHVGTSTYSQSFRWKGGPKPPDARVPDCGVREAMSLGSPVPTTSTARSALSTGAIKVFGNVEKWRPVDAGWQ